MSKIDIHADDYGITINASKKILELVESKKLTGISVMPNMSAFEEALLMWKERIAKDQEPWISVHLNFMEGHCLANPKELSYLVDEKGLFNISWGTLLKYNYNPKIRGMVKSQLKIEIMAQLERVIAAYELLQNKKLRVDSHQHTHMIPIVMEALLEVIAENNYPTEYIRLSKEPWLVYLGRPEFYHTYSPLNCLKVCILNWYSRKDKKLLGRKGIPPMLLSGVFLSGKMDKKRITKLYPRLKNYAKKRTQFLEVLFHPGDTLPEEVGEEFNHPGANEFYLSENRKLEYEAVKTFTI